MDVLSYNIPCSSFPRMEYAQKNSWDIYNSYKTFVSSFVMQENEIMTYDQVVVHIFKKHTDRNFPVHISDVVRHDDDTIPVETTSCENINSFLEQTPTHINAIPVILLDESQYDKIRELENNVCLFVLLSSHLKDKTGIKNNIVFSTNDCVRTDTCNLLENFVLTPMKEICEFLCLLKHTSSDVNVEDETQSTGANTDNTQEKYVNKHVDSDKHLADVLKQESDDVDTTHPTALMYQNLMKGENAECKQLAKGVKRADKFDTSIRTFTRKKFRNVKHLQEDALDDLGFLEQVDQEAIDGLLKSMLALYAMTNIPDNEQPHLLDYQPKRLNEKLSSELFSLSESITGMGYRSDKLLIFLSEDVKEDREIKKKIETLLRQNGVMYEIVHVLKDIQNLMHVGAMLEPVPGHGTLGCFATMGGEIKCILLSRHVAKCGKDMYFEGKRKVCRILPATLKEELGDLDIAAAEIYRKENICSTEFRDSTGKLMKGKLHEYKGEDKLLKENRKVYIWGASSRPGKGVIEIAEFKIGNKTCQQILIQIKDDQSKFAEPGDSGAIVCADDPDGTFVHVIGMVIGAGIGANAQIYSILPLSDGLKQLEKKTGQKFELC